MVQSLQSDARARSLRNRLADIVERVLNDENAWGACWQVLLDVETEVDTFDGEAKPQLKNDCIYLKDRLIELRTCRTKLLTSADFEETLQEMEHSVAKLDAWLQGRPEPPQPDPVLRTPLRPNSVSSHEQSPLSSDKNTVNLNNVVLAGKAAKAFRGFLRKPSPHSASDSAAPVRSGWRAIGGVGVAGVAFGRIVRPAPTSPKASASFRKKARALAAVAALSRLQTSSELLVEPLQQQQQQQQEPQSSSMLQVTPTPEPHQASGAYTLPSTEDIIALDEFKEDSLDELQRTHDSLWYAVHGPPDDWDKSSQQDLTWGWWPLAPRPQRTVARGPELLTASRSQRQRRQRLPPRRPDIALVALECVGPNTFRPSQFCRCW